MDDNWTHLEPYGTGPIELPLVDQFDGLTIPKDKNWCLVEFLSEKGQKLVLPISYRAIPGLVEALATLPAVHGGALPPGSPFPTGKH